MTETKEGVRIISSSERRLRRAQREMLKNEVELEAIGKGHAEVTGVNAAKNMELTPTETAASRPICENCAEFLLEHNVEPLSPIKPTRK